VNMDGNGNLAFNVEPKFNQHQVFAATRKRLPVPLPGSSVEPHIPEAFRQPASGTEPMKTTFKVNGKSTTVDVPPDMPLLWVLRDELNLKGTKFGCGQTFCGACTVHVKGKATRSCATPISAVAGSEITTIEGLSPDGSHPLQRAWEELDVPQCGYCQAGQLMSAAALLEKTPKPTDAQIDTAMGGNICRCATYLRIRQAIHLAADMPKAAQAGQGRPGIED
jgi:isoquinoline 1-oxidoreductase subunit alpha